MVDDPRQGGLANSSGGTLEKTVVGTLQSKGFVVAMYREYVKKPEKYGKELLLRNVPFKTIYKHPGNTEFLLLSEKYNCEIRIECKWQQSAGSVDEKFPYLYLNCIEAMPEQDIIIIAEGGGAKQGAVEWLKNATENKLYTGPHNKDKTVKVMTLVEFIQWANKTFR
jgi:hypothetical protein